MKFLARVLIAVLLASSSFHAEKIEAAKLSRDARELADIYQEDNIAFFDGRLPKQVTFSYVLMDPINNMAETNQVSPGRFNIAVGPRWMDAALVRRLLMFHEECHVYAAIHAPNEDVTPHGKTWHVCMLQLEMRGAFRDVLFYAPEDKP